MNLAWKLKMAKQKAEALLRDQGIQTLPIDPFVIAKNHDIEVLSKPDTVEGVSGMLLRYGDAFGIMYATHIKSEGFQRFSVAHELGHYFLEGHVDHVLPKDGVHQSRAGFTSSDPYELEADHFAAGLLMPSGLFKKELRKLGGGLAAVKTMATCCQSSITATAIRYAELTEDAVAIIVSAGQTIDYCILSDQMKSLRDITWLRKGSAIPPNTATARFNASLGNVERAESFEAEVDISDWFGGSKSVLAFEEVIGLGGYGKTLTVLSAEISSDEGAQSDVDYEDEDALRERWTPHFRN